MTVSLDPVVNALLSRCIFKYGQSQYLQRTLESGRVRMRRMSDFNDIYEDDYRLVHYVHSRDEQKQLTTGGADPFARAKNTIDRYLKSLRWTCFTRGDRLPKLENGISEASSSVRLKNKPMSRIPSEARANLDLRPLL